VIELKRIEKADLNFIKNIRNKYKQFLRQKWDINEYEQEQWFLSCKDHIFYTVFEYNNIIGVAGLTYPDWISRKVELSFITENYVDERSKEIEKKMLEIAFLELNFLKVFVEIYSNDLQKKEYLEKNGWIKEGEISNTYYNNDEYHNSLFYAKYRSVKL